MGGILAAWILQNHPETTGKRVSLYTDNQSIINALSSHKATPGQYLINSLRIAVNALRCKLEIRWISGHSKVKGNEAVDQLAKGAAAGHSSALANLPHILRTPLPISASAIKQSFMSSLKRTWNNNWNASPRIARIAQFGGTFPYTTFLKQLILLTRNQASLILQIRSAHFPLNSYLHRIGKSDTDRCQKCNPDHNELPPRETINHFTFECTAYNEAREQLTEKIGRDNFHLPNIMENTDRTKALTTFINRTGRLRSRTPAS